MSARQVLTPLDMTKLEIRNLVLHLLGSDPGSPVEGQIYYNTTSHAIEFYNGSTFVVLGRLDQISAPTSPVSMNSQRITSLADPTSAQDAATRAYVDAQAAGARDVKDSARVATTTALPAYTRVGNVLTANANGAFPAIDTVTLTAADAAPPSFLLKDGAAGADNGLYLLTTTGDGSHPWVATRRSDADSSAEMTSGVYVWITEGTSGGNKDTGWLLTTLDVITLNTTSLTFTQVSALGQVTAGAGLTKTGATIDVVAGSTPGSGGPGGGIVADADDIVIDKDVVARKFSADVGDGASTSIDLTHNLGTLDVHVQVYVKGAGGAEVEADVVHKTTNVVTLNFAVAPTSAQYRATIIG